jgi:hypothetical protein
MTSSPETADTFRNSPASDCTKKQFRSKPDHDPPRRIRRLIVSQVSS